MLFQKVMVIWVATAEGVEADLAFGQIDLGTDQTRASGRAREVRAIASKS
jgi:hypothetical protein